MIKLPVDLSGVPPYIIKVRKMSTLHVTINDVHVPIKGCSLFLLLTSFVVLLCKDCPGEDMACLFVTYASLNGDNVKPTLLLAPRVER